MSKQTLVFISLVSLLVIVAGSYYFFYIRTDETEFDIRKFKGNIVSIEGNTITLNGFFYDSLGTIPQSLSSERDFSFQVDGATQFEELVIGWPTWDKVSASGGTLKFNTKDLPQNREDRSLDDLKGISSLNPGTVYVEADFAASVHDSKNPVASLVFYRMMTMPSSDSQVSTP